MVRKLTHQQKRRVQLQQRKYQTDPAISPLNSDTHTGLLLVRHGASAYVETSEKSIIRCYFRQNLIDGVAGDHVRFQISSTDEGVIVAILPREAVYTRQVDGLGKPVAANMTQIVIVLAPQPAPTPGLLDKYLLATEINRLKCLIVFNKADLLPDFPAVEEEMQLYRDLGYPVVAVSSLYGTGFDNLVSFLQHETSLIIGQSGVGKSSLIKRLLPDQTIRVGAMSEATGFGCHTTSNAQLYHLPNGGKIIDTAGVRDCPLGALTSLQILKGFIECRDLIGQCKFRDCTHEHEPDCAIIEAVKSGKLSLVRYHRLLNLLKGEDKNGLSRSTHRGI